MLFAILITSCESAATLASHERNVNFIWASLLLSLQEEFSSDTFLLHRNIISIPLQRGTLWIHRVSM